MNLDALPRYEPPACANCGTMSPECKVPIDDAGTVKACCWVCAHMLTVHEHEFGSPGSLVRCGCHVDEIYPPSVINARKRQSMVAGEVAGEVSAIAGEMVERETVAREDRTQRRPTRSTSYLHVAARRDRRDRANAARAAAPVAVEVRRVAK